MAKNCSFSLSLSLSFSFLQPLIRLLHLLLKVQLVAAHFDAAGRHLLEILRRHIPQALDVLPQRLIIPRLAGEAHLTRGHELRSFASATEQDGQTLGQDVEHLRGEGATDAGGQRHDARIHLAQTGGNLLLRHEAVGKHPAVRIRGNRWSCECNGESSPYLCQEA